MCADSALAQQRPLRHCLARACSRQTGVSDLIMARASPSPATWYWFISSNSSVPAPCASIANSAVTAACARPHGRATKVDSIISPPTLAADELSCRRTTVSGLTFSGRLEIGADRATPAVAADRNTAYIDTCAHGPRNLMSAADGAVAQTLRFYNIKIARPE